MTDFRSLVWICHQPGMAGDSLTAFLNLHEKQASFRIIGRRMRTSTPGVLLNWAPYYDTWPAQQRDPNLWKQIHLDPSCTNFAQAHFFGTESQILDKFPGSRALRVVAENTANVPVYFSWLNHKLLQKRMYPAWHARYLKFAHIRDSKTRGVLQELCDTGRLRVGHYWSAWYVDRRGMDLSLVPDPWQYWLDQRKVIDFHPNLHTMIAANQQAQQPTSHVDLVYIDRLWPLDAAQPNTGYYQELCDRLGLRPRHDLLESWWQWWRPAQPPLHPYSADVSWILHK
jgi:hypothetical protein